MRIFPLASMRPLAPCIDPALGAGIGIGAGGVSVRPKFLAFVRGVTLTQSPT